MDKIIIVISVLGFVISVLGLVIAAVVAYYFYKENQKFYTPSEYQQDFDKEIERIAKKIQQQESEEKEKRKRNIESELAIFEATYHERRHNMEQQLINLQEQLDKAKASQELRIKEIEEETIKAVDEEASKRAINLESTRAFYEQMSQAESNKYYDFKEETEEKINELKARIKQEEDKYNEIVEAYKRAEQIKQDKDFYRIVISDSAKDDVKKLKAIAAELHDPSVLYKLIYKTYYERPFNEMVGRVTQDRGGAIGIYKITNLENGRVYIGQTRQAFKERWRTHVKRGLKAEPVTANKLYAAMWENGIENFTFEVLAECSVEELNGKEREYISFYHADTWGYNSTSGNG